MRYPFKRFNELKIEDVNFDFHMHTNQTDGRSSLEEMTNQARKIGLASIAFSEHVNMTTLWFPEFASRVRDLKARYSSKGINILLGIEVKPKDFYGELDTFPEIINASEMTVGSVHSYPNDNGGFISIKDISSLDEETAAEIEFNAARGLLQNPHVDVLGHPFGVFSTFFSSFPKNYLTTLFKDSLSRGIAIEINTKYLPNSQMYFELLRKINPYVSFGSDAHHTSEIARDFDLIKKEISK